MELDRARSWTRTAWAPGSSSSGCRSRRRARPGCISTSTSAVGRARRSTERRPRSTRRRSAWSAWAPSRAQATRSGASTGWRCAIRRDRVRPAVMPATWWDGNSGHAEERPAVLHDFHTEDLPQLPQRDTSIPATRWPEAPAGAADARRGLRGRPRCVQAADRAVSALARAGPACAADACYMALAADDLAERYTYRLFPDGNGERRRGGRRHAHALRTWKESLQRRIVSPR